MRDPASDTSPIAAGATLAAVLHAIDPAGLGGILVHAGAGPVRDRWLEAAKGMAMPSSPWRRIPISIADERLLGGLDLGATLSSGRLVGQRGVLADADGGTIIVAMAERLPAATAARIAAVIDQGQVTIERDGLGLRQAARFGVIALDEGAADDEAPPAALADRLAFHIDLTTLRLAQMPVVEIDPASLAEARCRLPAVTISDEMIEALCATALTLGVPSMRAAMLAVQAARVHAAFDGRAIVAKSDAEVAGRLVLAPRATQLPATEPSPEQPDTSEDNQPPEAEPPPDSSAEPEKPDEEQSLNEQQLEDLVLAAAEAAIPPDLLAMLKIGQSRRGPSRTSGKVGVAKLSRQRGRPVGSTRGDPRSGIRLSVIDTLRAAAPWQGIRARERRGGTAPRIEVRRDDFRIKRFKQRSETTTIFVVDASGSAALHRLAEAKGAIELLLADCYVRRDNVAMISFRGKSAELLLPPTRSLVRAKRGLAGLPGGGGTPLAAAIDAAFLLAQSVSRRDETPVVVFLTDGRANVCRDGTGGRAIAEEEAIAAARQMRAAGMTVLLVDTSPSPAAQRIASELGARYLALPYADARILSKAIQASTPGAA
jgi:magnesium chelatase subunit D